MVLPETALPAPPGQPAAFDERATGASGTRLKVATRPATVGATWLDVFHPGTPSKLSLEARVRVIADVAGALIQIHENSGVPRPHRRHGRVTPRHLLIGVDGSASLFNTKEPFSKLLPTQPDLGYLAPELLTQAGPSNQQSDVFSLGVLLWEALDNGRLFPHRRAAAISRLIARRSLPTPRIEDEWALPLSDVAMKALANDPEERYPNATAFWLALREHLPAPDNARAALARLAQRALKLELTTEIRESPPYLLPSRVLLTTSVPPERSSILDGTSNSEASARYSLQPEPSRRQRGASRPPTSPPLDDPAWAISDTPPPSSQLGRTLVPERASPVPDPRWGSARPSASRESDLTPRPPVSAASAASRSANELVRSTPTPSVRAASDSPVSTLHVNLPRDLVDASLPFYLSSQPASRPFPWGSLTFAALMFFGVGAAVAFAAVTVLRTNSEIAKSSAPAPAKVVPQQPAAKATSPTTPLAPVTSTPAPSESDSVKAEATPAGTSTAEESGQLDVVKSTPSVAPAPARQGRRANKAAKAKAAAPKPELVAPESKGTEAESSAADPAAGLPFVEQPY
jgi:hypothetical protein